MSNVDSAMTDAEEERQPLVVERFDLDETPREPNVEVPSPAWWPLPLGFPFVVDTGREEVIAPVLQFLASRHAAPGAFGSGRWTKYNSASAEANDLRDWWEFVRVSGLPWHEATQEMVDGYLMSMSVGISGATQDFYSPETIKRRKSTLASFHKWGRRQGYGDLPIPDRAPSDIFQPDETEKLTRTEKLHRYDANPQPLDPEIIPKVLDQLGPNVGRSSASNQRSCRSRLAFEIALTVGLRVDEVVNLTAARFEAMQTEGMRDEEVIVERLTRTKGLVPRPVHWPVYLIRSIQTYISTERNRAIAAARNSWLKPGIVPPRKLLLNLPSAGRNAGKATSAETLESDLALAMEALGLTRLRVRAEGTPDETITREPKHTFHDGRHTFAYLIYTDARNRGDPSPVQIVRLRLGHQDVNTTMNIYLRVFNTIGGVALDQTANFIRNVIEGSSHG